MSDLVTLRGLVGLPSEPAPLAKSALIMVDCQNTYTTGIMKLDGVEDALAECERLLARARNEGAHIIHIQHDAGPGTPYDVKSEIGQIAARVAPAAGETVITKNYPSSFEKTSLHDELQRRDVKNLVLAGFMTHMCINSTARAAFNHGYAGTVVASATATRALPGLQGDVVSADMLKRSSLAELGDMFAIVVPDQRAIPV